MRKISTLVIFSLLNIISAAQIPKWAQTNSHPKYPSSTYLLGVGIANEKATATELARADVAKQIQVKIESELETMEQEITTDDKTKLKSEIVSRTKSVVNETIIGIEIAATEFVKGQFYVLAVLNKQRYYSSLEQQLGNIVTETDTYLTGARALVQQGNIFNALDNYLSAQNTMPDFLTKNALYLALTGSTYPAAKSYSVAGVLTEARNLLAAINIKIISGDNQDAPVGKFLSEPLIAKILYTSPDGNEIGVKWYPVIIKYSGGEVINKTASDQDGIIKANILAVPTESDNQRGKVVFSLGLSNIPEIFRNEIEKIQATFSYNLIISTVTFSVDITDIAGNPDPELNRLVTSWINENGFKTNPDATKTVLGNAVVTNEKVVDSPAGKQIFIELNLNMVLTDKKSASRLATITATGKGMALRSRDLAIQKASAKLSVSKEKFAAFLQAATKIE
jgi:hypothetical protein